MPSVIYKRIIKKALIFVKSYNVPASLYTAVKPLFFSYLMRIAHNTMRYSPNARHRQSQYTNRLPAHCMRPRLSLGTYLLQSTAIFT